MAGANLWLDFPSVGATENLLMAAVLADGTTVIDNVAREPEITDLCDMLVEMGAKIEGVSTSTLTVHGVSQLAPVQHATVSDRIVAGTWAFATAIAGGDLTVHGGQAHHLDIVLDKLVSAGGSVHIVEDGFHVHVDRRVEAFDVVTLPYPGFPTDLQPFAMALAAVSNGTAMITENVFEARFMFVQELARLGADLRTDGHHAVVRGKPLLSGAPVVAHDIRAGAALVLAGLAAAGHDDGRRLAAHRPRLPVLRRDAGRARRGRVAGRRTRHASVTPSVDSSAVVHTWPLGGRRRRTLRP